MTIYSFLALHFVQHALMAGLLAAIVCGIVGTLVVLNRLVFLAGGVAHAAYGGVGLAICFGLPLLPTLLCFTSFASMSMGPLISRSRERTEVLIGTLWATGMTFGIVLLNLAGGYNADLTSYLFGSILAVSDEDLAMMTLIVVAIVVMLAWRYDRLVMFSFDREYARSRGLRVEVENLILLLMIACVTVILIRVVGIILMVALLTIPPYIGMRATGRMWKMMLTAGIFTLVFCVGGFFLAYALNLTAGAAIVLLAAVTLIIVLIGERVKPHHRPLWR